MGLLDLSSEVLTEYRADISDHKAKIKELQGAEKELAVAELENAEARNEHLEGHIESLGKLALALAAVKEVGEIIWEGYNESLKESRLETAAVGIDIEKLGEAAGGLRTHMELLTFAGKVQNSSFKATQEQLEIAERFMRKLEASGVPTAEAMDAVTNAVTAGRVKGLIPFGVTVNTHIKDLEALGEENLTLAQKTELVTAAYESMDAKTKGVVDSNENLGDSMRKTQVNLAESWEDLKKGLGQLVVAFQPLLEALALVAKGWANIAKVALGSEEGAFDDWSHGRLTNSMQADRKERMVDDGTWLSSEAGQAGMFAARAAQLGAAGQARASRLAEPHDIDIGDMHTDITSKKELAAEKKLEEEMKRLSDRVAKELTDDLIKSLEDDRNDRGLLEIDKKSTHEAGTEMAKQIEQAKKDIEEMRKGVLESVKLKKEAATKDEKGRESFMEHAFGKIDDINLYKDAFQGLTSAVGSGYEAMVKGSMSFSQAFKSTVADLLLNEGKKMQILAIENTAYGIAAAATGPFGGSSASQYFAAAAMFEVGAIAAGAAANAMGAGGSSSGGSGGSGSSSGTGGGSGGGSTPAAAPASNAPIIVYGDSFADDSPRMRQQKAKRLVALALGTSGSVNS